MTGVARYRSRRTPLQQLEPSRSCPLSPRTGIDSGMAAYGDLLRLNGGFGEKSRRAGHGRMCELMKIVSGHPFQIMPDRPRTPQWPTSQRSIDAPPSSAIMVTALGNWRAARRPTRLPLQPPVRGLDPRGPETRRSACSIPVLRCRARSESCGRCRRRGLR